MTTPQNLDHHQLVFPSFELCKNGIDAFLKLKWDITVYVVSFKINISWLFPHIIILSKVIFNGYVFYHMILYDLFSYPSVFAH